MRFFWFSFVAIMLLVVLLSCTGSRTTTSPATQPDLSTQYIPSTAGQDCFGQVCWGLWDVFIDPETAFVETVPIRGADFMVNIVNFLQPPTAPTQLIAIQIDPGGTDFSSGLVTCDVTIQHPLPGTKFGGFDVMGIVLDDWPGHPSPIDSSIIASMPPCTLLQNPDGWTRWWNQVEFTTYGTLLGYSEGAIANHNWTCYHTLNAFKYYCDDLEAEDPFDPDPAARGFFSSESPGINSRRYVLQFPGTVFHFKYAINASWATPNTGASAPYTADDFPPEANMAEAYKIKIVNNSSTAYYENASSFGGNLSLVIEVRDWQYDGNPDHADDEVQTITIASPTLFPTPVIVSLSEAFGIPDNTTAFRVPVYIEDVTPAGIENQHVLVCVTSKHPTTYEPQIPGVSGYEYPSGPLAAYAMIEVPILDGVTESTWPTFRRFYDRQGRTDAIGPSTDNVLLEWTEPNGQLFFGGIALDSKGRAICHSNNLYCIDLSGEVIWSAYIQDNSYMTPTVGPDDSVYIATNPSSDTCRLGHFDCNGEYVWSHDYDYGIMDCGPVLQDDGTILISTWDGILAKVDIMGNVIWDFETDGHSIPQGPAVGDDGTIYVACHDDRVYAVNQDGSQKWMKDCGMSDMCAPPALGPDGIFIGNMSGRMYCLSYNNGSVKWTTQVTGGCHSGVAVGDDGYIYFGTRKNWVYCLDQNTGNKKWDYETSHEIFTTTGVLDGAGHLYIGNVAGDFYCLNTSNGDVIWVYNTGPYEIRCMSPAITDDGAVVVGTLGGKLFAFKDE